MSGPVFIEAFAFAAQQLSAALGCEVKFRRTSSAEPLDVGEGKTLGAALTIQGAPEESGFLIGAAKPFEMEARARLEIAVTGGDEADRPGILDGALANAEAVLLADPTLGGRVAFAELGDPDALAEDEIASRGAIGWGASLSLTYESATALG